MITLIHCPLYFIDLDLNVRSVKIQNQGQSRMKDAILSAAIEVVALHGL